MKRLLKKAEEIKNIASFAYDLVHAEVFEISGIELLEADTEAEEYDPGDNDWYNGPTPPSGG